MHGPSHTGGSTHCGRCSTATVINEKIPCVSGPAQFICMLFKGQLYRVSVLQNEKVLAVSCTT